MHFSHNGTLFCFSLDLPFTAHPLSDGRGLIIAERADEWKSMFTPFISHDIHIDTCDSPMTGLAAIAQAVANRTPYRFILLGRQIQGMDVSVLAEAIKGDPACRETQLVLLSEQPKEDPVQCASTGFAACISRSADPAAAASTLTRLWSAAVASGRAVPFLSTSSMEATQPGEGTPMPFAGYRVLVADDNPVNQEIAVHLLEKLGCKSDAASDGMQAVDMHRAQAYDLILMDCNMPGLDGFQATQRIRMAESSNCRTPIVALTACTSQEEREQCLAAGMDDFLAKPIRPQTLKEMLARWLPPLVAAPVTPVGCDDELEAIQEMFGAGFSELASLYQNDTPPRIAALRDGYAAGDYAKVAKVAHALSGSSASIGAIGLSALCKELESRAKAGLLEEFEYRMAAIEAEYRRLSSKLQSMLTS